MSYPFMTIETVHGVRETVSLDHFIVGPQQVADQQESDRQTRVQNDQDSSRLTGSKANSQSR